MRPSMYVEFHLLDTCELASGPPRPACSLSLTKGSGLSGVGKCATSHVRSEAHSSCKKVRLGPGAAVEGAGRRLFQRL